MRTVTGMVTSTKMDKTVVITVHSYKSHPKYKKKYRVSKKFFADNPKNEQYEEGTKLTIYESIPLSKKKRWTVVSSEAKKEAAKTE